MIRLYLSLFLVFSFSQLNAQLSGSYTIDPAGSGSTNFTSFSAASAALSAQGVSSAVVFYAAQGTYNEQVVIDSVDGTSANHTVTFRPDTQATAPVIIEFAPSCGSPYVVQFDGADWVILDGLEVSNTEGSSCSHAIEVLAHSNNVTIQNSFIQSLATTTLLNSASVVSATGKVVGLTIRNNAISNGSIGIYISGLSSTSRVDNPVLEGNELMDNYYRGIDIYSTDKAVAHGNTVSASSAIVSTAIGISFTDCSQFIASSNYVGSDVDFGYGNAMYVNNCYEGIFGERNRIINNCLNAGVVNSTTGGFHGLFLSNSGDIDVFFNTINRRGGSSSFFNAAFRVSQGGVIDFRNNSVSTFNNFALYTTGIFIFIACDYNHYNTLSGNAFRSGNQTYPTLSGWQGVSSLDQNSVVGPISWLSQLECRTCEPILNAGGQPISGIAVDIDSTIRQTTEPDIGAFEFVETTEIVLPAEDTLCSDLVTLQIGSGGYNSIQWIVNGSSFSTDTVSLDATATCEPSNFTVSLMVNSDYCGQALFNEAYTLVPPVELNALDSVHLCPGDELLLGACLSTSSSYQWSTGDTTDSITVNESGTYVLNQQTANSCTSSDTVMVSASTVVMLSDTQTCDSGAFITFDVSIPYGSSYTWNGGLFPDQAENSFGATGVYNVVVTDSFGCSQSDTVEVYILSEPIADITWFRTGNFFTFLSQSSSQIGLDTKFTWLLDQYVPLDTAIAYAEYPYPLVAPPTTPWNVALVMDNGCGIDTAFATLIPTINGIEENDLSAALRVFPNPVASHLTATLPSHMKEAQVRIFNMAGQQVLHGISIGELSSGFDVTALPSGLYWISIEDESSRLRASFVKE